MPNSNFDEKLRSKRFRLSRLKIQYMKFKFSCIGHGKTIAKLGDDELLVTKSFMYL